MSALNLDSINWNPIEITANVINSGIEGLIGIEECTDYNIVKNTTRKKQTKKRKRNLSQQPESGDSKVKSKKKKFEKQEGNSKVDQSDESADLITPSQTGCTTESSKSPETIDSNPKTLGDVVAWSDYGLPDCILKAISELGFTQPTVIQASTLPAAVLGKRDILGAAETGSGKTLAFGLPILAGILRVKEKDAYNLNSNVNNDSHVDENELDSDSDESNSLDENGLGCVKAVDNIKVNTDTKPLYALILTPTRELAMQVKTHLTQVAKYTGINIAVLVGGMAEVKQERILKRGPEIVVATPGRLWELIQSGNPHLAQIDDIRYFAIDETDRMLERGHFKELHDLLERINSNTDKSKLRQNFVFSATLTLVHNLPKYLATKKKIRNSRKIKEMSPTQKLQKIIEMLGITNPKVVDITQGTGVTSGTLTECRITCAHEEKDYYVYYFLQQHPGRTLIFCNSIGCVKRLTTLLSLLNCNPLPLHASMQQKQRLKNLERFRDNETGILIATDVAARGLDIPSVQHVLHYQTPRTSESYVHRSGRTARASKEGITVLLMEPNEFNNYLNLCRTLGKSEDLPIFPVQDDYLNAVKQRVNLARDLDKLQLQVRKANSETGWLEKAAKEMDMIIDNRSLKYDVEDTTKAKKHADIKRKELNALLSKEIIPKGFNTRFPLSMAQFDPLLQTDQQKESAIDVLKSAVGASKKDKRKRTQLYKPKKQVDKKHVTNSPKKHRSFKTKQFKKR